MLGCVQGGKWGLGVPGISMVGYVQGEWVGRVAVSLTEGGALVPGAHAWKTVPSLCRQDNVEPLGQGSVLWWETFPC